MCRLLVLFECLDFYLPQILCQGSLLDCAWAFPSLDYSRQVYPSCFPISVSHSLSYPGGFTLSILPFVGWRLDRVRKTFLSGALVPLLCLRRVWFSFCPLSFSWFSRFSSVKAGYISLRFRALSRPLPRSCPAGLG